MNSQLVEDNLEDVRKIVFSVLAGKRHESPAAFKDRVLDAVNLGICQAAETFDETVGVKFITFAVKRCIGAWYDGIRQDQGRTHRGMRSRTLTNMLDGPTRAEVSKIDCIVGGVEDKGLKRVDDQDELEAIFRLLTPRERKILSMLLEGSKQHEVAEELKLTEGRISQILQDIREKARVFDDYR